MLLYPAFSVNDTGKAGVTYISHKGKIELCEIIFHTLAGKNVHFFMGKARQFQWPRFKTKVDKSRAKS